MVNKNKEKFFPGFPSSITAALVLQFLTVSLVAAQHYSPEDLSTVVFNFLLIVSVLVLTGFTGFEELWERLGLDFDRSILKFIMSIGVGFLSGEILYRVTQSGVSLGIFPSSLLSTFPYVATALDSFQSMFMSTLNVLFIGLGEEIISIFFIFNIANILHERLDWGFWPSLMVGTVVGRLQWAVLHFGAYAGLGIAPYIAAVFLGIVFTFSGWVVDVFTNYIEGKSIDPRALEMLIVTGIVSHFWFDYRVMSVLSGKVLFLAKIGLATVGLG